MKYRIVFQPRAETELVEAYRWMSAQSPARAARWLDGIQRAIDSLETHPTRCPLAPENEMSAAEVRQLLYGKRRGIYRIVFIIGTDTVHIVSVRHGARQRLRADELRIEASD
jgi:plasmid stabilization system protein ParE